MEIKRCIDCHKVQRAAAQKCSRCGRPFFVQKTELIADTTAPSLPSASPHRAGHYFGLHPEDQPYQSNKFLTTRSPEDYERPDQSQEPIVLPSTDEAQAIKRYREELYVAPDTTNAENKLATYQPRPHVRRTNKRWDLVRFSRRTISLVLGFSCFVFLLASSIIALGYINNSRTGEQAILKASPNQIRANDTFTLKGEKWAPRVFVTLAFEDGTPLVGQDGKSLRVHTGEQGRFQVQTRAAAHWETGRHFIQATDTQHKRTKTTDIYIEEISSEPPRLQLSTDSIDLGTNSPDKNTEHTIALKNLGGGTVNWQASSDQTWLTLSQLDGSFFGRQEIKVVANRKGLPPQKYTGQIQFLQQQRDVPLTLTVTMEVTAPVAPQPTTVPALTISSAHLTFSASEGQAATPQMLQLINNNVQDLDWAVTAATSNQGGWLTTLPTNGSLAAGEQIAVQVIPDTSQLAPGDYQGTLTFLVSGIHTDVTITLTISAISETSTEEFPTPTPEIIPTPTPTQVSTTQASEITVEPALLQVTVIKGQQPATLEVSIKNSGKSVLNWQAHVDSRTATYVQIAPALGSLEPGRAATITFSLDTTQAPPGMLTSIVTFSTSATHWNMTRRVELNVMVQDSGAETVPSS